LILNNVQCIIIFSLKTLNIMHDDFLAQTENQNRQYLDAQALLRAHGLAIKASYEVRGSMIWRELRGVRYLIRTSVSSAQKTIGPDSADTRKIYSDFMQRKQDATQRVKSLSARIQEQRKLNRVYRIGRTPNVVVKILQCLASAGLADKFLTVGTHAMYAYESACGVMVAPDALATRDLDLLFDSRKRLAFVSTMQKLDTSLIAVLRKADPSFHVMRQQLQTAVNQDGFEVDVIRRMATDGDPHPLRMTDDENDLWAVQVPSGQDMLSGRLFEQMVVSTSGEMAIMRTLHPLDFVRIKQTLGHKIDRDPLKQPKDLLQAKLVNHLWEQWLQHRPAYQPSSGQ
jgi:Nucleotidyltransferase